MATCISEKRVRAHIATEAMSLAVTVPFLIWASNRVESPALKWALRAVALGELVIDGYLIAVAWPKRRP